MVYHIFLHLIYIGVTTKALAVRLRKHHTDATSYQDCSTLHCMMLQTDRSHWGILPLQCVQDSWYASIRERHWWFTFKKYACNDVAPGISTDGEGLGPRGWLNQRVLAVLHSIKQDRQIQDWARLRFLRTHLQQLASQMSVPLYAMGSIVVPNLLPNQKSAIHRVSKKNGCLHYWTSVGKTGDVQSNQNSAEQPAYREADFCQSCVPL